MHSACLNMQSIINERLFLPMPLFDAKVVLQEKQLHLAPSI